MDKDTKSLATFFGLLAIVFILLVVWFMTVGAPEEEVEIGDATEAFAEEYDGIFGTFQVVEDEDDENVIYLVYETEGRPGSVSKYMIKMEVCDDIDEAMEEATEMLEGMREVISNGVKHELEIEGFDDAVGYIWNAAHGETHYSMLSFALAVGDVLITTYSEDEGKEYLLSSNPSPVTASIEDLEELFTAILEAFEIDEECSVSYTDANAMATFFSYAYYDGAFGTYTVDESSTEESATVTHEGARTSNIVFTVSEDVDEDYVAGADAINAYIEKYPTLMGASPERLEIEGFERFLGYKYDVNMSMGPTSVTFTCILFVASYGDTVIDAYTTNQYVMDTFATDDDIDALMDAILLSVGA